MTDRLAADPAVASRASSIQSIANSVREVMSSTMKDAVNTAHSKAVAHEAKSAAHSVVKGIQSTLHSLRDGTKQSTGVKKVPVIMASNSCLEDSTATIEASVQMTERAMTRETNAFFDRKSTLDGACDMINNDLMLLNAVWHKVMSPSDGERSRRASQLRDD